MEKLKKVFSPGGDKDDEVMYGTPSKTSADPPKLETDPEVGKSSHSHGLLGQVLHHGDEKHSDQSYGTSTATGASQPPAASPSNTTGLASGKRAEETPQSGSNFGRDAGTAGAVGAGAAGVGTYAYESRSDQPQDDVSKPAYADRSYSVARSDGKQDEISQATYTERSYPIGGTSSTSRYAEPSSTTNQQTTSTDDSHYGRDAAIAGGGAGALGAGALAASGSSNRDVNPGTSAREIQNPQQLDSSSRLGPHVPGEFPTESGRDPHVPGEYPVTPSELTDDESKGEGFGAGYGTTAAVGAGAVGATGLAGYEASKSSSGPRAAEPDLHPGGKSFPAESSTTATTTQDHTGRNTALGTGAGLSTAVAHESSKSASQPTPSQPTSQGQYYERSDAAPMQTQTQTQTQSSETHYGRDAAIVGGATAVAGGTAYEGINRSDTGPASKTIGPHKSNIANVIDPRVKPEPEKMKENEPISEGPYKSDIANMADPRVKESTPGKQKYAEKQEDDSHLGRDAAIAGGAGAAGVGAYELSKDRDGDDKETKRREKEEAKQREKEQKQQQKEAEKREKERQKEAEKHEKERQKEAEKQEKERQKEAEKREKEERKAAEKREKAAENHEKHLKNMEIARENENRRLEEDLRKQREKEAKKHGDDSHLGRDAAIAGGAGAAGVGAYELSKEKDDSSTEPGTPSNKIATDQQGHKHLHKKSVDSPGEKKPGLFSKLLHRNKDKTSAQEGDSPEPPSPTSASPSATREAPPGQESSSAPTGLPLDDQGMVTIVKEGADPTAPALVVKEKPEGGVETAPK